MQLPSIFPCAVWKFQSKSLNQMQKCTNTISLLSLNISVAHHIMVITLLASRLGIIGFIATIRFWTLISTKMMSERAFEQIASVSFTNGARKQSNKWCTRKSLSSASDASLSNNLNGLSIRVHLAILLTMEIICLFMRYNQLQQLISLFTVRTSWQFEAHSPRLYLKSRSMYIQACFCLLSLLCFSAGCTMPLEICHCGNAQFSYLHLWDTLPQRPFCIKLAGTRYRDGLVFLTKWNEASESQCLGISIHKFLSFHGPSPPRHWRGKLCSLVHLSCSWAFCNSAIPVEATHLHLNRSGYL